MISKVALCGLAVYLCACQTQILLNETVYQKQQGDLISSHVDTLIKKHRVAGHNNLTDSVLLGVYGWHNGTCGDPKAPVYCQFGAYTYSEEAFKQAQKMWEGHLYMSANSDLLLSVDSLEFDPSIVGYQVSALSYCLNTDSSLGNCEYAFQDNFLAGLEVTQYINNKIVRVSRKAKRTVDEHYAWARPKDYQDMCQCHGMASSPAHAYTVIW